MESGIPLTMESGIQVLLTRFGIRYMESGIHTVESRIQDCPGQMGSSSCLPLARPSFLHPVLPPARNAGYKGGEGGGGRDLCSLFLKRFWRFGISFIEVRTNQSVKRSDLEMTFCCYFRKLRIRSDREGGFHFREENALNCI